MPMVGSHKHNYKYNDSSGSMLHFATDIRVNKTQQPDSWPTMTLNQSENKDTHIGHII